MAASADEDFDKGVVPGVRSGNIREENIAPMAKRFSRSGARYPNPYGTFAVSEKAMTTFISFATGILSIGGLSS